MQTYKKSKPFAIEMLSQVQAQEIRASRILVYCLLNRFIFSSDRHILWWSCHVHLLTRCG
jgi:hypothetical protein